VREFSIVNRFACLRMFTGDFNHSVKEKQFLFSPVFLFLFAVVMMFAGLFLYRKKKQETFFAFNNHLLLSFYPYSYIPFVNFCFVFFFDFVHEKKAIGVCETFVCFNQRKRFIDKTYIYNLTQRNNTFRFFVYM
jgi:hypothetical protein